MREAWTKSWDVNVTSTHVITHRFIPLLLESDDPRLVFLASGTSSLANSESPHIPVNAVPPKGWPKPPGPKAGMPAYRSAKAGLNMMMRCVRPDLLRIYDRKGIKQKARRIIIITTRD